MTDTILALLAVPALVITAQSVRVPECWYKYKPLGCPLCLTFWASAAIATVTAGPISPGPIVLQTLAGVTVGTLVAAAAPWLFRWDASDEDHNP